MEALAPDFIAAYPLERDRGTGWSGIESSACGRRLGLPEMWGIKVMTIADLKKMQDREPFRPFIIHLTNGEKLPVQHSETMHVNPEADLFTLWVGPEWNLIDVAEVSRISVMTKAGPKRD